MKKILFLALGLVVVLGLNACGMTKEKLGLNKKAPNEFMVVPRSPLSLPPEYELRPVIEKQTSPSDSGNSSSDDMTAAERSLISEVKN